MNFDLGDAVGNGQPSNPAWPSEPSGNSIWPGGNQPAWQGGGGNPSANPAWNPSGPSPAPGPGGWAGPSPAPGPGGWAGPSPAPGPGGWSGPSNPQPPGPGGWAGPSPSPGPGPVPANPRQNLTVPYTLNLPNGVYDKLLITVAGTVKSNADQFKLDFYTSNGDLAFHFNPRFNENGKQVVVRNACIGKKWGGEERNLSRFPFVRGQPFEIKIMCTNADFRVAVNNSHLLEFRHRMSNLRSINRFNVYSDVTLSDVRMETMR